MEARRWKGQWWPTEIAEGLSRPPRSFAKGMRERGKDGNKEREGGTKATEGLLGSRRMAESLPAEAMASE